MHVMELKGKWVPLDVTHPDFRPGVTRHAFDPLKRVVVSLDEAGKAVHTVVDCPSMTRQADKDDCDINVICRRYGITERTTELLERFRASSFGDVSELPTDFREALDLVRVGQEQFAALPLHVRTYFDNDAGRFLEAVQDEGFQVGAGVDLGLFTARAKPVEPVVEPPKAPDKPKA